MPAVTPVSAQGMTSLTDSVLPTPGWGAFAPDAGSPINAGYSITPFAAGSAGRGLIRCVRCSIMLRMLSTYSAALTVTRQSLDMLRDAIDGLPPEALAWTPAPNTNSMAVLVRHSLSALPFFFACSVGKVGSIKEYRATDRAEAFTVLGGTADELKQLIAGAMPQLERLLENGTQANLDAMVEWPTEDPTFKRTGGEALINIVGHLREHVGHTQLMRDIWLAEHPA